MAAREPADRTLFADNNNTRDNIARRFAKMIDAKIFGRSVGVADVAVGIATAMGFHSPSVREIKRAALLHDIGKAGVNNMITDKPGKLTPEQSAGGRLPEVPEARVKFLARSGFKPERVAA